MQERMQQGSLMKGLKDDVFAKFPLTDIAKFTNTNVDFVIVTVAFITLVITSLGTACKQILQPWDLRITTVENSN